MPVPIPVPLRANANMRLEAKYNVITECNFDLHSAAATGNMGLVEYALARGQPINSVLDGVLPLHAACAGGNEQVVKLLIEHGADVNAPRLPRRYSNEKNRDASAPIVGTSGSTPLHFAAANGNTNIVTALLLKGAHPDRCDKHGVTAEMLARQNGWLECAEVLKTWVQNKDKDLLEREAPAFDSVAESSRSGRDRQGSFGTDIDAPASSRRRINVKRSMDTALSMLKVSSSGLSDAYHKHTPDSSSMPPSPIQPGEYSHSFDGGRRYSPSPSPIEPGSRRPSLPYIHQSHPSGSPRRHKSPTPSKGPPSPRRPRSAGTGAESSEANSPRSGKRLGTKYSLMNIFKKTQGGESTSSFERIPSQPASLGSISNLAATSGSPSLRGSNSTNSLVRFVDRVGDIPVRPGSSASSHDKPKESTPDSAPPTVADFPNLSPQLDDDEQDYGRTYDHPSLKSEIHTRPRDGSTASGSSISSAEFPFSINRPPPDPLEEVAKRSSEDGRDRGDSVSSTSTNPNLSVSDTTSGSGGSTTATPPLDYLEAGSEGELKVFVDEPQSVEFTNEFDGSLDDRNSPGLDILERRACSPLEIDLSSISSHAQAEALVQRAQRDILEMVQEEDHDTASKMPLSARLAAYGESLALERRLREQKTESGQASAVGEEGFLSTSTVKSRSFVNRQRSMEGGLAPAPVRSRFRRPHTSDGTSSNESEFSIPTSTHSLEGSRVKHHTSRSASAAEAFSSNASPARLPAGSMYKQPIPLANITPRNREQLSSVSSFEGADTDTELGPGLFRVSTAPHPLLPSSVPKAKREQARHLASANKLTRMGFSRSDTVAKSPPSSRRFGGLKSLMQTFKGKQ
ncbi:uncharacterized protein EV420DRAFT_1266976 [Desarmillaria tabescens]|uniref:Ankyrin n=1 Tax=Armillaria tabescens TaxID=1929756 RepID=A0AA39N8S7_ARMTA|nr:uncharacterized protein EV420DRAFT_1266976 [Desarmillaria tabescens]KAK0461137.1 hypothetical protein EV420DRAFT_1266976 [Desarmillaria tabescens]